MQRGKAAPAEDARLAARFKREQEQQARALALEEQALVEHARQQEAREQEEEEEEERRREETRRQQQVEEEQQQQDEEEVAEKTSSFLKQRFLAEQERLMAMAHTDGSGLSPQLGLAAERLPSIPFSRGATPPPSAGAGTPTRGAQSAAARYR